VDGRSRRTDIGVNCITAGLRFLGYKAGHAASMNSGAADRSDNCLDGHNTMTQEVNTAATDTQRLASRRGSDLLGVAYLATAGVVMTAWIGSLIWGGVALVVWLLL
jgi:hypothetical protein